MNDGIILGTGNSRYLKGAGWPSTYAEFKAMAEAGTLPIDLNGINAAGWQQLATVLNKANLLDDATATLWGLDGSGTVNQALNALRTILPAAPVSADRFPFLDVSGNVAKHVTLTGLLSALQNIGSPKIATGNYTGTGTYGSGNPTVINFGIDAKIVLLGERYGGLYNSVGIIPMNLFKETASGYYFYTLEPQTGDNKFLKSSSDVSDYSSIKIYSTINASYQFNAGENYWVAIG